MRSSRSLLSVLALALFALFLIVSLPLAMGRSVRRVQRAIEFAGESPLDERIRTFGAEYSLAIEEIRRRIPRDAVYAVVNGDAVDQGGTIWVRFDLAPRRAILLGKIGELDARTVRGKMPRPARWVVIASGSRPPELIDRAAFLRHLREREARR